MQVEQKVKYKSDLGITGSYVQRNISGCAIAKGTVILKIPTGNREVTKSHTGDDDDDIEFSKD